MTIQVNQDKKYQYELEISDGKVVSIFRQTTTSFSDMNGNHLSTSNHREVVDLQILKDVISGL